MITVEDCLPAENIAVNKGTGVHESLPVVKTGGLYDPKKKGNEVEYDTDEVIFENKDTST